MYKASLIVPLPEAVDKGEGYWVFAIFYSAHREYNSRGDDHWFASLVAQTVKNLPAVQEMWVQKAMAAHSSVLAWRIPGTGAPGGLPSVGSHSQTRLKWLSSSSSAKHYSKSLHIFSFNIQNSMRKAGGFFFTSREIDMEKFTQIVYKNLNSGLSVSKGYHLVHWSWYLMADSRNCIICWVCKDKSEVVLAVHPKVMIIFQLGPNFWMM